MKPRLSVNRETAMTLFEVGVVVAIIFIVSVLLLSGISPHSAAQPKAQLVQCMNNLKQVGLAYRIWEGDNGDIYPMGISVTKGGSKEMVQTGNVVTTFQVMSNELSTPKILFCPSDSNRSPTMTFNSLAVSNISYFVGVGVTNDLDPQAILSGDCHFEIGGVPVKAGLVSISTNDPVAWAATRHVRAGNLLLGDGSVQLAKTPAMRNYFVEAGEVKNRLAIP